MGIGDKISTVWNKGIKPAFGAIRDFIEDKLIPAFKTAKDKITEFWDKIKSAAQKPISFVVNTIWNNIWSFISGIVSQIVNWIVNQWSSLVSTVRGIFDKVYNSIKEGAPAFVSAPADGG